MNLNIFYISLNVKALKKIWAQKVSSKKILNDEKSHRV